MAHLASGDNSSAALAFTEARAYAATVRNTWLAQTLASVRISDQTRDPADALADVLDGLDDQLRAGWTTHAWTSSWFVAAVLVTLGRVETAAFFAGACSASGVQPMFVTVPDELAGLDGEGDGLLHRRHRQGRGRSLAEILRVARDESPLPPL